MVSSNLFACLADRIRPAGFGFLKRLPAAAVLAVACSTPAWAGLLVSSTFTDSIKEYDLTTGAYLGDFVSAGSGGLQSPYGLTVTDDKRLLVSSSDAGGGGAIRQYNAETGAFLGNFVAPGAGGLSSPTYITIGRHGNVYVSDLASSSVKRYDEDGNHVGDFVVQTFNPGVDARNTGLSSPYGLAFGPGPDKNLYVSSAGPDAATSCTASCTSPAVKSVNGTLPDSTVPTTTFIKDVTADVVTPFGLAFEGDDFFVSDFGTNEVKKFDMSGALLLTISNENLRGPDGLAFGPDGNLYVVSSENNSVLRFDPANGDFKGVFVNPASNGGLLGPTALAFNPFQITAVPEPSSVLMMAVGLAALLAFNRKRRGSVNA